MSIYRFVSAVVILAVSFSLHSFCFGMGGGGGISNGNGYGNNGYVPQDTGIRQRFPATIEDVVVMGTYGGLGLFKRPGKAEKLLARDLISQVGLAGYKIERTMMGPSKPFLCKLMVGRARKMAIAKIKHFHPTSELRFAKEKRGCRWDSHVDVLCCPP